MTWKIYTDRNAWVRGEAMGEARSLFAAKIAADSLGATHIASADRTYYRSAADSKWRGA